MIIATTQNSIRSFITNYWSINWACWCSSSKAAESFACQWAKCATPRTNAFIGFLLFVGSVSWQKVLFVQSFQKNVISTELEILTKIIADANSPINPSKAYIWTNALPAIQVYPRLLPMVRLWNLSTLFCQCTVAHWRIYCYRQHLRKDSPRPPLPSLVSNL